jgi:pyruvate/2-oxoglutarate dehydrogenase complex dihydrolipoamide dehydrogenase (E3) component
MAEGRREVNDIGSRSRLVYADSGAASRKEGITMSEILTPDLCVIGAGAAGLSVAAAAAAFGVPVVLVEKGAMGGECLNAGCVPSKALIAASERMAAIRSGGAFGISTREPQLRFDKVMKHVHDTIAVIAPTDSVERFTALSVRVIKAEARFSDTRSLIAGDVTIRARRFVIATGSRPVSPAIEGLEGTPYLTNETIFGLETLPKHLAIIGGGPIGMELAQAFHRLGSRVTLLEAGQALAREEPEMRLAAVTALKREGILIREGVSVTHARFEQGHVILSLTDQVHAGQPETVQASHLLVAVGRTPAIGDLDLEKAGIRYDRSGIAVNKSLRSSNRRIYAIGDCASGATRGLRFTHAASQQAGLVVRHALFRQNIAYDPDLIPRVTFTDPEIASVGLSEDEARKRHGTIHVLRHPFAENDRARAELQTQGLVKLIATRKGKLLGASIAGSHAGEMISFYSLALTQGLGMKEIAQTVFPYPVRAEAGKRAAIGFYAPLTQNSWLRRLISVLRRFG